MYDKPNNVILYGGTGQAKVVRPIIEHYGDKVVAVFDDTTELDPPFEDVPLYCGYESFLNWKDNNDPSKTGFVITIGNPHGDVRLMLHNKFVEYGFIPYDVIDPSAIISKNCSFESGIQIMAGAIIMPESKLGKQCIINTKASVDHECVIGDGSEVGPGATLCGHVEMRKNSWVCAGATILPRIIIGENSIVGAGAVLRNDAENNVVVAGVPAT